MHIICTSTLIIHIYETCISFLINVVKLFNVPGDKWWNFVSGPWWMIDWRPVINQPCESKKEEEQEEEGPHAPLPLPPPLLSPSLLHTTALRAKKDLQQAGRISPWRPVVRMTSKSHPITSGSWGQRSQEAWGAKSTLALWLSASPTGRRRQSPSRWPSSCPTKGSRSYRPGPQARGPTTITG